MENYIYMVIGDDGSKYYERNRTYALDYYKYHHGTKVLAKTMDLYPKYEVIIDKPNVDISLFRKDEDILNKTTVAMRKAVAKYDKKNTKQINLKFNLSTDNDILEKLENVENVQGFIKDLIRKELNKN